jgi:hypothetical protein
LELESQGDAVLQQHEDYPAAVSAYERSMEVFEDPEHAVIMGKRAFGYYRGFGIARP